MRDVLVATLVGITAVRVTPVRITLVRITLVGNAQVWVMLVRSRLVGLVRVGFGLVRRVSRVGRLRLIGLVDHVAAKTSRL